MVVIALFFATLIGFVVLILLPGPEANAPTTTQISNFAECVAAGYPVMESYPRQCTTPAGEHFTEDIGNALEKQDMIVIETPRPGDTITSPLVVTGQARGNWYFEASFPVELRDATGKVIAQGYAQAQGEWTTDEFVPFQSVPVTFAPQPAGSTGTLVFKKDNPSGLPEYDDALMVPVTF